MPSNTTPFPDQYGSADNCTLATPDYFIEIYGLKEAIELTNIDDPSANIVRKKRIQVALNDAARLIKNYIDSAPTQGKIFISGAFRRTQATLARCYLDVLRPRAHVLESCERALIQMDQWASRTTPPVTLKWQHLYDTYGKQCFVRSSYQRDRRFTPASMNNWTRLWGANDRYNQFVDKPPERYIVDLIDPCCNSLLAEDSDIPEEMKNISRLYDQLNKTLSLSSFNDTDDIAPLEQEDNDVVVGNANDQFQNNNISLGGSY